MKKPPPAGVFFALFTLSGFAGLIYESIWSHYLKLFLGHAAYAQTLVLAIFMGGMAIGAWLVSRYTGRIRNLLLGYAAAELGIGILAIVFHRVFVGVTAWAFDSAMPALGGAGIDLFKWALASLLILPASILLGTTFPLMSAGILRLHPESGGRSLSMLYFTNSFGAAVGVLASGFFLIDRFGLPGTILTAGLLNVALALGVWMLARGLAVAAGPSAAPAAGDGMGRLTRAVLLLAFATGAASFIYEITWIRMLTLGLGASTHSFEVMLAAFILAMSLGAFWFRNRIGALRSDLAWLAGLLFAKAFFAVYAVWIYGDVLAFIQWMMQATARTDGGYVLTTVAGLAASMVVMFPTAFCAGMTLPLATHALTSRGLGEASIGKVYGANTAGCILGAAFATHLGMELAGVKGLTGIGALLDAAVGVLVLVAAGARVRSPRAYAVFAVLAVLGVAGFFSSHFDLLRMSSGVFRMGQFQDPAHATVRFYRDGKTATIAVLDTDGFRSIRTNGKPDASIRLDPRGVAADDEPTMTVAAALPLAMKPDARRVANIGFGSGMTTHTLLGSDRVTEVDTIEIERMMVEGARLFELRNSRAFSDPRSHIHIEDAKTWFASSGKRYDVIVSEPSNPWVSGVSTLFSEEFYRQVKRYLEDDGLFVQWVQSYEISPQLLASIFTALGGEFGDYAIYHNTTDLLVVATKAKALPPMTNAIFSMPGLRADLARLGYVEVADLQALRIGGKAALGPYFASYATAANSDFFPIVDQRAPRARFTRQSSEEFSRLRERLVPALALLDGDWATPLERIQSGGVTRTDRVDDALMGAESIGVFLNGEADTARTLEFPARAAALLARSQLPDCSHNRKEWLIAIVELAKLFSPYLAARDTAPFFDRIQASRCAASLDEAGRRHLALLRAMSERDAQAMYEHASYLIAADRALQVLAPHEYYEAAIAGAIATGRVREAVALRERLFGEVPLEKRAGIPLRVVLAKLHELEKAPGK